jgi:hypothetical protein
MNLKDNQFKFMYLRNVYRLIAIEGIKEKKRKQS